MSTPPLILRNRHFIGAAKSDGSDNHAFEPRAMTGRDENIVFDECIFDANGASEALKLPQCRFVSIEGGESRGGVEDCVDIVRGSEIHFIGHRFVRNGAKQDVTLKGGARRVSFIECPGLRKIVIGDYTKYDALAIYPDGREVKASPFKFARPGVREVLIVPAPGEPFPEVVVLHGNRVQGGPCKRIPAALVKVYFWARARFFKEKNPAPAESFRLSQLDV